MRIVKTDLENHLDEVKSGLDKKQIRRTSWWQTATIAGVALLGIIITAVITTHS